MTVPRGCARHGREDCDDCFMEACGPHAQVEDVVFTPQEWDDLEHVCRVYRWAVINNDEAIDERTQREIALCTRIIESNAPDEEPYQPTPAEAQADTKARAALADGSPFFFGRDPHA